MGLDELIAGLRALLDDHEERRADDPGEGNYGCEDCVACYKCRFCMACDSCDDCTYCEECVECQGCTQSKRSLSCQGCSYVEDSRTCESSRYLTLCIDCRDCTHCLACVGLSEAEFHVLNEKVSRKEYYEVLRRVRETIEGRLRSGWRPEVIGLEAPAAAEATEAEHEGWSEPEPEEEGWPAPRPVEVATRVEAPRAAPQGALEPAAAAAESAAAGRVPDPAPDPWLAPADEIDESSSPWQALPPEPVNPGRTLARGGRPDRSERSDISESAAPERAQVDPPRAPSGLRQGRRPPRRP